MYFKLIAADGSNPIITQLKIVEVLKNSARINIRANEPVSIYYMVALNGTKIPPFKEVFD